MVQLKSTQLAVMTAAHAAELTAFMLVDLKIFTAP
jgi:hypothetical protein